MSISVEQKRYLNGKTACFVLLVFASPSYVSASNISDDLLRKCGMCRKDLGGGRIWQLVNYEKESLNRRAWAASRGLSAKDVRRQRLLEIFLRQLGQKPFKPKFAGWKAGAAQD